MSVTSDKSRVSFGQHSHSVEYPQLNLCVMLVGNCFRTGALEMFVKAGCTGTNELDEADLVVFLGGEDVDPALYSDKRHRTTFYNRDRDDREKAIFDHCVQMGIPMFGICRGMQLIHVLRGGKLYQDVRRHTSPHDIVTPDGKHITRATSMHHQMCMEDDMTVPIAYAAERGYGSPYATGESIIETDGHRDLEAAAYYDVNAFCVQGHPEVGGAPVYTAWCLNELNKALTDFGVMARRVGELAIIQRGITQ